MCFHRSLSYERGWCGGLTFLVGCLELCRSLCGSSRVLALPCCPRSVAFAMAAAQVFSIELSATDGGLLGLLTEAGVDVRVIM